MEKVVRRRKKTVGSFLIMVEEIEWVVFVVFVAIVVVVVMVAIVTGVCVVHF